MPVADVATAKNLMLTHFKDAWDAQAAPVPVAVYENLSGDPPSDGSPYVKVFLRHTGNRQVTIAEVGARRFRKTGILTFEVYTGLGKGVTADAKYVKVVQDAFEGSSTGPDGVWFRDARSLEQGARGGMWVTSVLVNFEYDTIG